MFKLSKSNKLNILKVYEKAKHIHDDLPYVKRRKRIDLMYKILKYFSYAIIAFLLFVIVMMFVYFNDLHTFYTEAMSGKRNIEISVEHLRNSNYNKGKEFATLAQDNFSKAGEIATKYNNNFILKRIGYFQLQIQDLQSLIFSAEVVSGAIKQSMEFASSLEKVLVNKETNFNQMTEEERKTLLKIIYESSPELTGIKANIDLALINLENISFTGVLLPFKNKIEEIEYQLGLVQNNMELIIPLSNFVPVMLGYPEETGFLFVLQNSNELRPTGGFIGTYGILETKYGDIKRLDTHDIYHLDMPVKDKFSKEPPEPLKKYMDMEKWYMRDANWSPDWPDSAELIEWFFYQEDKLLPAKDQINNFEGEFSGVIAITPKLITDLLSVLGSVYIEGEEFNEYNFIDLLQYKVEQEYIKLGIRSWHRKEVIGEILKELKIKLFNLSLREMYDTLGVFEKNLEEKNVLFYFKDDAYQEIVRDKSWAGEILQPDSDYLMVVDANMASYKTDAVMSRSIDYSVREGQGGVVNSKLRLNYSHHGTFDWKTTRYRSYTRVYVPRGSQLIDIKGVEGEGAEVYDEYGKTVFAFFSVTEPGKISNIEIDYVLPRKLSEKINSGGEYSLYVQKQPGNKVKSLNVSSLFNKGIETYMPTGLYVNSSENALSWETNLVSDRTFFVNLKQ